MVKNTFRILCADDSVSIRTYLTELLQSWGYSVTACSNGKEAWETYQNDPSFSVFILDWVMPEMNGLEACKLIRNAEDSSYKYIIMLTSKDSTENIVEALNSGADDYLTKPFHPAELKARIHTAYRFFEYEKKQQLIADETRFACYQALTELAEARDYETGQHLARVSAMSRLLAEKLGPLAFSFEGQGNRRRKNERGSRQHDEPALRRLCARQGSEGIDGGPR